MNVSVDYYEDGEVKYFTGRCSHCGQFNRYWPQCDEKPDHVFEEGFFDCGNCE